MSTPETTPPRGGAPVGFLSELPPVEAGAVLCLRQWCDGAEGRRRMSQDFAAALGSRSGEAAIRAFEDLCDLCTRHGRRPLMRHHLGCKCLGADEACFANFIAAASEGSREDALLFATLIVRADMAPWLAHLAETFGLSLRRMAATPAHGPATETGSGLPRTLH
ncbi:hypothetical protein [Oceanicola sp. 22II-s10i]|uniref:hypothetical protein n=1 Tax=Oceanicola sp. 22II-s10i TaxID=1317116 RepID=UPI000B521905|nr:hypothetical protein [Oceanicola sp. 22II-s10i]